MYRVLAASIVRKKLSRVDPRYCQALQEAIKMISSNPLCGKPLSGEYRGQYSFRVGIYRLVYSFDPKTKTVLIANIDHRKDVYR